MKKIKYLLIALAGTCLMNSCTDFLEVDPEGKLTVDVYFEDDETIDDALAAVYSCLNWRFYRLGNMYFTTHEMCADDFEGNKDDGTGQDYTASFTNFGYMADNWYLDLYWGRWYEYIHFCNTVTDLAKDVADRSIATYAEAQARFFRGYHYFDLLNVFGEAVIRDHIPEPEEYDLPTDSEEEVYNFIISDLEFAIANLKRRSESQVGRVTVATAQGLLAKVYLFRQDWSKAAEYARAAIDGGEYSLETNYREIFRPEYYSPENMLPGHYSYQPDLLAQGRIRNPFLEYQGVRGEFGSAMIYPSENLVNAYEAGDPRKEATIFVEGETVEGYNNNQPVTFTTDYDHKYSNKKVIWPVNYWNEGEFMYQEIKQPFLRLADVILIYAEASNELGNTSEALNALEQIRYRARGNKSYSEAGVLPSITETNKDTLRELIWKERRVELALEGHRWFDLVRYEKIVSGYTTSYLQSLGRSNFNYAKYSKFPIPSGVILNSDRITQKAEWN